MRASLGLLAAAALAAGAVMGVAYGLNAAEQTGALLLAIGALVLAGAHVVAARRASLRLRAKFSLGAGAAVGCVLLAVVAGAELMFVSAHDAVVVAVIAVFAGAVAVRAAQLPAAGVLADVEALRDGLRLVGEGRRDVHLAGPAGRDELRELAGEVDRMVSRLSSEEQMRRELVAAVSHDLRTPIASLRLLVDAVGEDFVDEPTRRRYLRTMGTHVDALTSLIEALFELTRLEAGDIAWTVSRVSLGELVDEAVSAMRPHAELKGVAVCTELPEALSAARANPEQVQRVLFNLIHNAVRHTPADGSVTVRATAPGAGQDEIEIEVADTGAGMEPGSAARMFEPFVRGEAGGFGLGLAISRAIVEAHGGRIWIESSVRALDPEAGSGPGTRVRFTLPVAA